MKTHVKICGIQTLEAVQVSIEAGADFLGFIFVSSSRRYIEPDKAEKIINAITPKKVVGVFKNTPVGEVNSLIQLLKLPYVQLHGQETPEYCKQIISAKIIKAFPLSAQFDVEKLLITMKEYNAPYFLLDREKQGQGESLDLEKVKQISSAFPIFLAGGLNSETVTIAVERTHPFAVDVIGGVETDGVHDYSKIKEFIKFTKKGKIS